MRKRIFRGASLILLTLSLPAIGWNLAESTTPKTVNRDLAAMRNVATPVEALTASAVFNKHIRAIYDSAGLKNAGLDFAVFKKALTGYYNFRQSHLVSDTREVVSIVDFNQPSTAKRLWIIDLAAQKVLFNTWVAHGQGSGDNYATHFSNRANSHQSSLGFYVTSDTYFGKHGLSLKLNGMDNAFNTNALSRSVVIHGAEYVSEGFVKQHGRLGRSHGCPAVPVELTPSIIEAIKGRTTLFIHGPASTDYVSGFLNESKVLDLFESNVALNAAL